MKKSERVMGYWWDRSLRSENLLVAVLLLDCEMVPEESST
jgi:hypothetical protein